MAPREDTSCGRLASARAVALRLARRAAVAAAVAPAILAAPAGAVQLSPDPPHSPNTDDMSTAYWVMIAVTIAVIVVVNVALIGALVRFRERRGRAPARITAGRHAISRIAVALAIGGMAIFVFGIVLTDSARTVEPSGPDGLAAAASRTAQVGVKGVSVPATATADEATLSEAPPGGGPALQIPAEGTPLEISAIGQQWLWRFEYPGGVPGQRTFSYGELTVPVDTAVVVNITSTDVIHGWWVPSLTGQVQAVPGTVAQTWFKADEVGVYEGRPTVFNGTSYPAMAIRVRVVESTTYQAYVEALADGIAEAQGIVRDEVAAASEAAARAAEETTP
ncbi:MAG: cytochrome c oxidase subunit II [bacterium]